MTETSSDPTPDRSWRIALALESAVAGALVAYALAAMLNGDGSSARSPVMPGGAALLGGQGGLAAGFILSGFYGHPGRFGWLRAILASAVAPSLAGLIAGTCLFPGPGTAVGAFLPLSTFRYPLTFALWAVFVVIIHLSACWLRHGHFGQGSDPAAGEDCL